MAGQTRDSSTVLLCGSVRKQRDLLRLIDISSHLSSHSHACSNSSVTRTCRPNPRQKAPWWPYIIPFYARKTARK